MVVLRAEFTLVVSLHTHILEINNDDKSRRPSSDFPFGAFRAQLVDDATGTKY